MGLIVSAYARLCRPDAVRAQVLAHLFLARLHNSIKSSYERRDEFASERAAVDRTRRDDRQSTAAALPQEHRGPEDALAQLTRRKQGNKKTTRQPLADQSLCVPTRAAARSWDWRGFPDEWLPLVVYEWISISWMIMASARTIFHERLAALVAPISRWLLNGMPGNCLLMGRMVKPLSISDHFTVLVAIYHLGWRFVQKRARRSHLITMVVFLLASERDLERVHKSIEAGNGGAQTSFNHNNMLPNAEDDGHMQTGLARRLSHWRQTRPTCSDIPASAPEERLFRQVMCYQVHRDQQVRFRVRPNRTREARKLLERRLAFVSLAAIIFFALEFAVAFALVLVCISSDYRYASVYSGCDPQLDDRLARGELTFFSSFCHGGHHLLSGCVDFLESFVFWLDSGLSLTFVPAFSYMLNYDLLLYWSELNRKLESLAQRSKHAHLFQVKFNPSEGDPNPSHVSEVEDTLPPPCHFMSTRTLESEIHELQFEIFDFFHQVRRADLIVGDTLTHAILIWLTACAFVYYSLLTYDKSSLYISFIVELVLILGAFVICLATFHLLELRRCCLRSYRTLCTLMAYDQTSKKRQFITLMDFYLGSQSATTYHLFRTYAYEPTTFITIIGWTFSCFFIAAALLKPHVAVRFE